MNLPLYLRRRRCGWRYGDLILVHDKFTTEKDCVLSRQTVARQCCCVETIGD